MFGHSGIPLLIWDGKSVMAISNIECNEEKLGLDQKVHGIPDIIPDKDIPDMGLL